MIPARYDFTIYQGQTLQKVLTLKNESGDAIDLNGYSGRLMARVDKASDTTVITSEGDSANITVTVDDSDGTITLLMTAAQTAALDFNLAFWDLEIYDATHVYRLYEGIITLSKEVTR